MRFGLLMLLVAALPGCFRREHNPTPPPVFVPPPPPDRAPVLEAEIRRLQLELVAREARIQEVSLGEATLTRHIEDLANVNHEMNERLRLSSASLEQLAVERARLQLELEAAKTKLREIDPDALPPEEAEPAVADGEPAVFPAAPPEPGIAAMPEEE